MPEQYLFFAAGVALGLLLGWLLGRRSSPTSSAQAVEAVSAAPVESGASGVKLVVNGNTVEVPTAAMTEIQGLIQSGQKIEAIKALRLATGLNLAAAKSVVASLEKVMA
jgi:ribosomal protein L7/L12